MKVLSLRFCEKTAKLWLKLAKIDFHMWWPTSLNKKRQFWKGRLPGHLTFFYDNLVETFKFFRAFGENWNQLNWFWSLLRFFLLIFCYAWPFAGSPDKFSPLYFSDLTAFWINLHIFPSFSRIFSPSASKIIHLIPISSWHDQFWKKFNVKFSTILYASLF